MISLHTDGLTKRFNRHSVFEDLSFSHTEGVLGISGLNGSGKSTLLKSLAYLIRPNSGDFEWKENGKVLSRDDVKPLMSYVAPYINLYSEMTAFENLAFLLEVSGHTPDRLKIMDILSHVQMSDHSDSVLKNLSTGQTQRIKLGAALVRDPRILFLDEPGSNLDENGHELVSRIINDLKESGTTVIVASNDPEEIRLCDNVISL